MAVLTRGELAGVRWKQGPRILSQSQDAQGQREDAPPPPQACSLHPEELEEDVPFRGLNGPMAGNGFSLDPPPSPSPLPHPERRTSDSPKFLPGGSVPEQGRGF